ncbi:hypothetical protein TNCV_1092481 [Trichonephila clavipes]|nr:hypothetical protein TNCV_1092481 [Trichonephila clavipes]
MKRESGNLEPDAKHWERAFLTARPRRTRGKRKKEAAPKNNAASPAKENEAPPKKVDDAIPKKPKAPPEEPD